MAKQNAESSVVHPVKQGAHEADAGGAGKAGRGERRSYHVLSPIEHDGRSYRVGESVDLDHGPGTDRMLRTGVVGEHSTEDSEATVRRAEYQAKRENDAEEASRKERQLYDDLGKLATTHQELRGHLGAASTLGSEVMFPEAHDGAEPLKYAGQDLETLQGKDGSDRKAKAKGK